MEKKSISNIEDKKSNIILENRNKLSLTGVLEVIGFDDERITLNTRLGALLIKGSNLKMNKLDVQNGEVIIIGVISSIVYNNKAPKKEKKNIIQKLFK